MKTEIKKYLLDLSIQLLEKGYNIDAHKRLKSIYMELTPYTIMLVYKELKKEFKKSKFL